jgi:CarD family transcriptional regulator
MNRPRLPGKGYRSRNRRGEASLGLRKGKACFSVLPEGNILTENELCDNIFVLFIDIPAPVVIYWKQIMPVGVGFLFNIGDKVVYPLHGAGVIESIEEKEILGERQKYYIMKMPIGNMKVMVPMRSVKSIGLREVVDEETVTRVLERLKSRDLGTNANWNRRYRANMDKMRSGDIYQVADVVRSLMLRDREKGLSTGERKMLDNARQILISELVLAKGIDEEQASDLLDELVCSSENPAD